MAERKSKAKRRFILWNFHPVKFYEHLTGAKAIPLGLDPLTSASQKGENPQYLLFESYSISQKEEKYFKIVHEPQIHLWLMHGPQRNL